MEIILKKKTKENIVKLVDSPWGKMSSLVLKLFTMSSSFTKSNKLSDNITSFDPTLDELDQSTVSIVLHSRFATIELKFCFCCYCCCCCRCCILSNSNFYFFFFYSLSFDDEVNLHFLIVLSLELYNKIRI